MADVSGICAPRFEILHDLLSGSLDAGTDVGASLAVTIDGELVVDLWGGHADEARTTPWEKDTITNVWSTTKTMTSLAALVLVDRGELDVYAPVARYWPEFARNGKEEIAVRHLLSHTSGLASWEPDVTAEDIYDLERSTAALAAQAPWWEPGTASGYHALNQGHLVGEVIRRITGRTLGRFFAEEIAGPLDADFHIGLAPEHDNRVSLVIPLTEPPLDANSFPAGDPRHRYASGPALDATAPHDPQWRRAEIGAANGHGNARSVARIQAVVANGGTVDGVTLLSPDTIELIFDEQANGPDLILELPYRFGIGYGIADSTLRPDLPDGRICFWGGWGGSSIVIDCDRRMTVAYMMNKMISSEAGDDRSEAINRATYAALGVATT
ncbi:MAG: serine hydrolase domain-containing protein [Actinomycetota bacterium]